MISETDEHHGAASAAAYLREISDAAQVQADESGVIYVEVLRIRAPVNFEEARALSCWIGAEEQERGAPIKIIYLGGN